MFLDLRSRPLGRYSRVDQSFLTTADSALSDGTSSKSMATTPYTRRAAKVSLYLSSTSVPFGFRRSVRTLEASLLVSSRIFLLLT